MSSPSDAITSIVAPSVKTYLSELALKETPLLDALESCAIERGFPLVGRESGRTMRLLSNMIEAKRVFEFGSGFGYSAYFFAQSVGADGEVHGSEIERWAIDSHRLLYSGSPLASRIQIHQGDAFDVFAALPGHFDVVFLDLEKVDYSRALEVALPRLRIGGLLMADNVLWGGKTALDPLEGDESTAALQAFNQQIHQRDDVESVILPVGDGLSISRKIG